MGLWYSFKIALGALVVHKGRTILTALGVIIGVASVITMVGLGQGFGDAIKREINASGETWIYVAPGSMQRGPGPRRQGRLTEDDLRAIQRLYPDTVTDVVPMAVGQATVKFRNRSSSCVFTGGTPTVLRLANLRIAHGTNFHDRDVAGRTKVVVLGANVVKDLTGSPTSDMTGQIVFINRQAFTVVGVLERKGQSMGDDHDQQVYMPYTTAMRRMMNTESLTVASVAAASRDLIPRVEDQIQRTIRARHGIKPPYSENDDFFTIAQEGVMREVGMITTILSVLLGSIAAISLLVGGIGIMNIMLVSVTERTREIGLRKAIGASTGTILSQFLIEAVMVSVLGGLLGVTLGFLGLKGASAAISAHSAVKLTGGVSANAILLAFTVSATIGIVFGFYPAFRAARLDPIDALRYE